MCNQLKMEAKKQRTLAAQAATAASLAAIQKMIDFHSAQGGSLRDAQEMRPDLDEEDSDDEDSEVSRPRRNWRSRRNKNPVDAEKTTALSSCQTNDKYADDDEWDNIEARLNLISLKA